MPKMLPRASDTDKGEMMEPGIHDLPLADYLADPCPEPSFTSSAAAAIIARSPLHAWHEHPKLNPGHEQQPTRQMDIGSAAHAVFLEADESRIVSVGASDYRTKATQGLRDEAHAAGKIPLLEKDYDRLKYIVEASRRALVGCDAFGLAMEPERSLLWQEGGKYWCRARPDLMSTQEFGVLVNYKTTSTNAEPSAFARGRLVQGGYHLQAYHHLRGYEELSRQEGARYIWVVQEIQPPYGCSLIEMPNWLRALAESQWSHAFSIWVECLHSGEWPGYPAEPVKPEPQAWLLKQWCERPEVLEDPAAIRAIESLAEVE